MVYQNGGFDINLLEEPAAREVINETSRILRTAIDSGLPHEVPETVRYALENNAFVFSGFKTFHSMREIGLSMLTDKGDIKPFKDFMTDVRKINKTYNHNYLYAEYNHTLGTSLMAARWIDFEKDSENYDLQYRTANDGRVREEHAALHNITLPASDPFWDKYFPPNGWNCRCTVSQVRKGKYPTSDPDMAMLRGDNCTDGVKKKIFRYNPGKTLQLFPPKHPYYKAPADAKAEIQDIARYEHNKALYEKLKGDKNYTDVQFDKATGGLKATHIGHNFDEMIGKYGISRGDYEKIATEILFKKGYVIELIEENDNLNNTKQPDGYLNGSLMDIKGIEGNPLYALKRANKQMVESVILYFHDQQSFDLNKMTSIFYNFESLLEKISGHHIPIYLKKCIVVVNSQNSESKVFEIKTPKE